MGDVYDAMNRAQRDKGPKSHNAGNDSPTSPPEDTTPVLPSEQVAKAADSGELAHHKTNSKPDASSMVVDVQKKVEAESALVSSESTSMPKEDPASPNRYSSELIPHHDRASIITEQYRAIRTQMLARIRNQRIQTVVITSASPNEGKSVTALNMGITFSELRTQKTLVVEGDLRRPSFPQLLDRDAYPGLLHVLKGEVDKVDDAIHPTVYDNLYFMPAGGRDNATSTELLSSPRMIQVLAQMKDQFDHIFVDTPPVLNVTDASILGAICDQVLLVIRMNTTPQDLVDRAKRLLRASNCNIAGAVLTHLANTTPKYLYRYAY